MQLSMNVNTIPEAQTQPAAATKVVLAGKLFDPYTLDLLENQAITISSDSGLILDVTSFSNIGSDFVGDVIDLRNSTVLPGFVDTHVHCKRISFISDTAPPISDCRLESLLTSIRGDLMGGPAYQREYH